MSTANALKEKLGKALSRPAAPKKEPDALLPRATVGGKAAKLSVSLYPRDIECMDQIKDFMRGLGFRNLADSEALRLACRAIAIDDRLGAILREMQTEDGRRKRQE